MTLTLTLTSHLSPSPHPHPQPNPHPHPHPNPRPGEPLEWAAVPGYPTHLCLADGELFVAVDGNSFGPHSTRGDSRIEVLDPCTLQFVRRFGGRGSGRGTLESPKATAVHRGCCYVADCGNHRVAIFTRAGQFLRSVGDGPGALPGTLMHPRAIAIVREHLVVSGYRKERYRATDEGESYWASRAIYSLQVLTLSGEARQMLDVKSELFSLRVINQKLYAPSQHQVFYWRIHGTPAGDAQTSVCVN